MILGIDWSLRATGLAALCEDGSTDTCTITTPTDDGTVRGIAERIEFIADKVEAWADLGVMDYVVIEGPLEHAPSAHRSKMLGGWWYTAGRVAQLVRDPVLVVPPKTRAKYATGNGSDDKHAVLAQVRARYPQFDIPNDNVADAVALVAIGARTLGRPIDPDLPLTNLAALTPAKKKPKKRNT